MENRAIYDYKLDGYLPEGEAILIYEDGTRERITLPKEEEAPTVAEGQVASKDSYGNVIQYFNGYAWGISDTGETFCLGTEKSVKEAIDNPKLLCGIAEVDAIIQTERKINKEKQNGTGEYKPIGKHKSNKAGKFRPVKSSGVRVQPPANIKHRQVSDGQAKKSKRIPVYKAKQ